MCVWVGQSGKQKRTESLVDIRKKGNGEAWGENDVAREEGQGERLRRSASSDGDLQHTLGWFAAKCEAAGKRVSTSKSEVMVSCRRTVDCSLRVGSELLPQAEEFLYLGIFFKGDSKMEREMDRRIGAAQTGSTARSFKGPAKVVQVYDRVPPGCLPLEVFQECPTVRIPQGSKFLGGNPCLI